MTTWDHGYAATRSRWAMAFLTLLAFLCQSFVTQTHLHAEVAPRTIAFSAAVSGSPATLKAGQPTQDVPDCPICREISHGGTYLPPVPVAVAAVVATMAWHVPLPSRTLAPSQYSHAWRSRAPPIALHA